MQRTGMSHRRNPAIVTISLSIALALAIFVASPYTVSSSLSGSLAAVGGSTASAGLPVRATANATDNNGAVLVARPEAGSAARTIRSGFLIVWGRDPTTHAAPEPVPPGIADSDSVVAVHAAIRAAATEFGIVDEAWYQRFLATAYCESRYDVWAVGKAGERGLWQWMPMTWAANMGRLGYSEDDVWDARASSRLAALLMSEGKQWMWSCWARGYDW